MRGTRSFALIAAIISYHVFSCQAVSADLAASPSPGTRVGEFTIEMSRAFGRYAALSVIDSLSQNHVGVGILKNTAGFTDTEVAKLRSYALSIRTADQEFQRKRVRRFCDERNKIKNIESLGIALNSLDADVMVNQEGLVAKSSLILGRDLNGKLDAVAESERLFRRTLFQKEWSTWLVANKKELNDVVDKLCKTP